MSRRWSRGGVDGEVSKFSAGSDCEIGDWIRQIDEIKTQLRRDLTSHRKTLQDEHCRARETRDLSCK